LAVESDSEEEEGGVEEEVVALDDVKSVDEDAVPHQKIEIDNTSVTPTLQPLGLFNSL
jgi:hypothetical protein